MTLQDIKDYAPVVTAVISFGLLGLLINVMTQLGRVSSERLAVRDEKLESFTKHLQTTETWHLREKESLRAQITTLTDKLQTSAGPSETNLVQAAINAQQGLTNLAANTVKDLVTQLSAKLDTYQEVYASKATAETTGWRRTAALGALATGSIDQAAAQLGNVANASLEWDDHFSLGVLRANTRGGAEADLLALRAYNDAIALAPSDLDVAMRARLFTYRGAMLKRLKRLKEAEADLNMAISLTNEDAEIIDARYNLAGVYAMQGRRAEMLGMVRQVAKDTRYRLAIEHHLDDFFQAYAQDPEFLEELAQPRSSDARRTDTTHPNA